MLKICVQNLKRHKETNSHIRIYNISEDSILIQFSLRFKKQTDILVDNDIYDSDYQWLFNSFLHASFTVQVYVLSLFLKYR